MCQVPDFAFGLCIDAAPFRTASLCVASRISHSVPRCPYSLLPGDEMKRCVGGTTTDPTIAINTKHALKWRCNSPRNAVKRLFFLPADWLPFFFVAKQMSSGSMGALPMHRCGVQSLGTVSTSLSLVLFCTVQQEA